MPKQYSFPTLYDDVLKLKITKLKEWRYLDKGNIQNGDVHWTSRGGSKSTISIKVNTVSSEPYVHLNYKANGEPKNYKVLLVSVPSNLGKGVVWYFLCPQTMKRCRNLYLVGGLFLHREAFKGVMYESQTYSKSFRLLGKSMGAYFKTDKIYEELYSKHFKKTYKGKLTKRYLKLLKQIEGIETIDPKEIDKFFLK
ncbi:hypothetical protein [Flavicella sp.]|uniref:hypothetical protein n=1 Tax=Flavicella sp. TaxID=2957742 RepID=UPI003017E603